MFADPLPVYLSRYKEQRIIVNLVIMISCQFWAEDDIAGGITSENTYLEVS